MKSLSSFAREPMRHRCRRSFIEFFEMCRSARSPIASCRAVYRVRYFKFVRRHLYAIVAVGALLWAGTGVSVLAVALHESLHHADPHDHHEAVRVALHGHAHDGTPDHDHDLAAPPGASQRPSAAGPLGASPEDNEVTVSEHQKTQPEDSSSGAFPRYGPPPYLLHCVLLT